MQDDACRSLRNTNDERGLDASAPGLLLRDGKDCCSAVHCVRVEKVRYSILIEHPSTSNELSFKSKPSHFAGAFIVVRVKTKNDNENDTLIEDGSNMCWTSGPPGMSDGVMIPRKSIGYLIEGRALLVCARYRNYKKKDVTNSRRFEQVQRLSQNLKAWTKTEENRKRVDVHSQEKNLSTCLSNTQIADNSANTQIESDRQSARLISRPSRGGKCGQCSHDYTL